MKLMISTRNAGKMKEILAILDLPGVEIVGADEVPGLPDVVEDRDTFEGNATKKAVELAAASSMLTLADDSGLEVDALGGEPGVYSARYAGEPSNDAANNRKLLAALDGAARFRPRGLNSRRWYISLGLPCVCVVGCLPRGLRARGTSFYAADHFESIFCVIGKPCFEYVSRLNEVAALSRMLT